MKKLLVFIGIIFIYTIAIADTINLHWINADGTTYQNSTCVVGGDLIIPTTPPTKYGHTFTGWKLSNYTKLEYIESTGGQYIDTDVYPATGWKIRVKALIKSVYSTAVFFGCTSTPSSDNAFNGIYRIVGGGINRVAYGNGAGTVIGNISGYDTPGVWYDMVCDNGKWNINGDFIKSIQTSAFESEYSMYLFARNTGGQVMFPLIGSISICQIWDDSGTLVRDFIPVLDGNNVPCMFDKVSSTFFYNAGTGDFIAGPVVNE